MARVAPQHRVILEDRIVATDEPMTIFVAMPGTTLGANAKWTDIEEIKRDLYQPIADAVGAKLGTKVVVQIEKDREAAGPIHHTMFKEAIEAPIYIADLTGANPNVYLELGVRWAVRDNVTVLVSQDVEHDVRFNVAANRVVQYSNLYGQLNAARQTIVNMIMHGLTAKNTDSPVRQGSDLVTRPKAEVDALHGEIAALKTEITQLMHARGDDLFKEAMAAPHDERVRKLRRVLEVNDTRADVHAALGRALRDAGDLSGAAHHLGLATRMESGDALADYWRELGITQSRKEDLQDAVHSLGQAVKLNPKDGEAYSGLGGAHRRIARSTGDRTELRKARDAYREASEIGQDDLYARANAARLDVQLAENDDERDAAVNTFRDLNPLAGWKTKNPKADWAWLDLAETFAFSGHTADALDALREGMRRFQPEHRATTAQTAMQPVHDMLTAGTLPAEIADALRRMLDEYQTYL